MESIKKEVLRFNPEARIEIVEMCTPSFNNFVLAFKPNVILTFPFTCTGFATWYYLFKKLFNCKILSLRAEGIVDFGSEYNIQFAVGFDRYGKYLVDYELFWGKPVAEVIGRNLLRQSKLSSMDRVKVVGYPRLESYFNSSLSLSKPLLPERICKRLEQCSKNNTVFFVTGFHFANYSRQDLFDARDLDAENRVDRLLEAVEITKKFRQEWIDGIRHIAIEHKDLLIVLKKHPIERKDDYASLSDLPNVLFVYEDIDIQQIMPYSGLFFHYGSTSLVDAYLSRIPSVYVYSDNSQTWYSDMGWPSTNKVHVKQIPAVIKKFRAAGIPFIMTKEMQTVLKDFFDIGENKDYTPSRNIAELIVDNDSAQRIPLTDKYLWKALISIGINVVVKLLSRTIKFILRIDQNEPLLKRKCSSR